MKIFTATAWLTRSQNSHGNLKQVEKLSLNQQQEMSGHNLFSIYIKEYSASRDLIRLTIDGDLMAICIREKKFSTSYWEFFLQNTVIDEWRWKRISEEI